MTPRLAPPLRRPAVAAAIVIVVAAVGAGTWIVTHQGTGPVRAARATLARDGRFVNGPTAASTFASISQSLMADGSACNRRLSSSDGRCSSRFAAAAYASVVAVMLANCTQPGVFQARRGLDDELAAIAALDARPGSPTPTVPPLPTC